MTPPERTATVTPASRYDDGPALSVVIVTYNSPEWTIRCLDALTGDGTPTFPHEIVIVDSGSDAETRAMLRGRAGQARVLLVDGNIGFGRGCNLGVSHSRGRWILLLNPDAVVLPGSIDAMLRFAEGLDEPERAIVGGRTLRPDGTTEPSSCWGAPTLWSLASSALGLSSAFRRHPLLDPESLGRWERDTVREVDTITGCLLLVTRALYDRLGGFDPRFFMYGEDVDLCHRARASGVRTIVTPDAVVMHAVGASSSRRIDKLRLVLTGKVTLTETMWDGWQRRAGRALLVAGVALRALGVSALRRPSPWRELWRDPRGRRGTRATSRPRCPTSWSTSVRLAGPHPCRRRWGCRPTREDPRQAFGVV